MSRKPILISLLVFTGFMSLLLVIGGTRLLAQTTAVNTGAPALISYQGYVTDSSDNPLTDGNYTMKFALYTAESGGTKIWEETQNSVPVSNGFFSVLLGNGNCSSGCPLDAGDFSDPARYLQTSVDTGSGFVDFPRQQLASAPYSLQAEAAAQAETAASAPWSGLTGVPAGFADGTDDGTDYENVITVAKSGGDYTSVADALNDISSASADNRYLVWVGPGIYTETQPVEVSSYVHLRGSGQNATKIVSTRSASSPNSDSATVDLADNGRISQATVANSGSSSTYAIAIYSALATRAAVVDHVTAIVDGDGGTGHYAVYLNDAEPIIKNSTLMAGGATGFGTAVNAALGSVNISNGFPQALIENSILMGGAASNKENCNDPTGTGFGLQLSNSSPVVRKSYICGGHRGIAVYTNGHAQVQSSSVKVSSTGSAFLFEISASGSIKVANSGVSYIGNKFTGAGTSGLSCVHTYNLGTYAPLTDAVNSSATACN